MTKFLLSPRREARAACWRLGFDLTDARAATTTQAARDSSRAPRLDEHVSTVAGKAFSATPDAIEMYQHEVSLRCLAALQQEAEKHQGLDYLQVFDAEAIGRAENLW